MSWTHRRIEGSLGVIFRQLFDRQSCTYTYLLADEKSREGVFIDSVWECGHRDGSLLQELDIKLKYLLETHVHADHITGVKKLRETTGACFALGEASRHPQADRLLSHGDVLSFGSHQIRAIAVAGHTEACIAYACGNKLFTGDALLVRGCGRTDFQGGSPERLYHSVHRQIYTLADDTLIYPGHDYHGRTVSTVGEEKRFNPRLKLTISLDQFSDIMDTLGLPYPKMMDVALPKNLRCLD